MLKFRRLFARIVRILSRRKDSAFSIMRAVVLRATNPGLRLVNVRISRGVSMKLALSAEVEIRGTFLAPGVHIGAGPRARVLIEADYVGPNSVIVAQESIVIEKGSKLAEMVVVRDADHDHARPLSDHRYLTAPVRMGADVWIGSGAKILRGVTIGSHATVGAGAVVISDVESRGLAVGVPARSRSSRINDSQAQF